MDIESNQWYRPVLYLRWLDKQGGQLFDSSFVKENTLTQTLSTPEETLETPPASNPRSEFYKKRLAAKREELAAIESQLEGVLSNVGELKLNRQAELLLKEIEELEAKL
jgi:hypothetical protein